MIQQYSAEHNYEYNQSSMKDIVSAFRNWKMRLDFVKNDRQCSRSMSKIWAQIRMVVSDYRTAVPKVVTYYSWQ